MFREFFPIRFLAGASLAAALMLSIAGAALAVPVITRTGTTPFYSPDVIMMAKRDGGLPAQILGSPSPGANERETVAKVRLPASVGGGRIVPAAAGAGGTRLVLVFNNDDVGPEEVCRSPSAIKAGAPGTGLHVYAVLCRGNDFFSHAVLRDESVRGVRDPHYANAMEQLLLALMPPEERTGDNLD